MFVSFSLKARHEPVVTYTPIAVNIDTVTDQSFPAAYLSAPSHYLLTSSSGIDSVLSEDSLFMTEHKDKNHYVLRYNYLIRIHFGNVSAIPLRIVFHDGSLRHIKVKYIFFSPISITYTDSSGHRLSATDGVIRYGGYVRASARWVVPNYVEEGTGIKGVFMIDFFCGDKKIDGISGWYDSGDCSRPFDLSGLSNCGDGHIRAVIDEEKLGTFYPERMGIALDGHLKLDKGTPAELVFIVR